MAPPRWQQGWTNMQGSPPPGVAPLNGASLVLTRVGGAGPWTPVAFGQIQVGDDLLTLPLLGTQWTPQQLSQNGQIVLAIP